MSKSDFKHILVATDFGEHAKLAVEFALSLAAKFDAQLTLLHAQYVAPPAYDVGVAWPVEALGSAAQKALDQALAQAKQRYPTTDAMLQVGYPADVIVKAAEKRSSDLIVIGTHGRRGVSRMLLGSVAEKVVRSAHVPVLTIPGEETAVT
jgi:universal stress protein A